MIGGSSSQCCAFVSKLDEVDKHTTFNPFSGLFLWLGTGSMPGKTQRCWFAAQSWSCSPIPPIQIQSPKQKWPQIHWYRREWTSYGRTAWVASTLKPAEKDVKTFRNISPCTCLLAESSHEATENDDQEGKVRSTVGSFVPLELL